jgi:hypothetical protein
VALLAGVNAAALHSRHQPHFPPVALRPLLAERSVLRHTVAQGGARCSPMRLGRATGRRLARRIRRRQRDRYRGRRLRFRDIDDLRAGRDGLDVTALRCASASRLGCRCSRRARLAQILRSGRRPRSGVLRELSARPGKACDLPARRTRTQDESAC